MATQEAVALAAPSRPRPRPARTPILPRLGYWSVVVGLIGLNAWWWWDDRPLPDVKVLERLIGTERNAEAELALRRILRKSPHDADARILLARALGARGDNRGCADQLHLVPYWAREPRKREALYGECLAWLEVNRARDAEDAGLRYLADDPNHSSPRPRHVKIEETLINLYALEDRWDDASAVIWRAYSTAGPSGRRVLLELSLRTKLERSAPRAALETLRQYVAADPQDWEARLALARAANAVSIKADPDAGSHRAEADAAIAASLAARPKDSRVWRDWMEMLDARDDFDALAKVSEQAPPEADTDGRVWVIRGKLRRQAKDVKGAAEADRRAVALRPYDPVAHYSLAQAEQRLGHSAEAAAHRARHLLLETTAHDLTEAANEYRDATEARSSRPEAIRNAVGRLARMCRTLGWVRDADGWDQVLKDM